jgi:FMN-dependent NADH-azoreductase
LTQADSFLQEWLAANFTPADKRSKEQTEKLAISNALIQELKDADVIVVAVAVYNFSIPASLKAWLDQVKSFIMQKLCIT